MPEGSSQSPFRLLVVPGTTPARWVGTWGERRPGVALELVHAPVRDQLDVLRDGGADVGLVRLDARPDGWSAIPLYTETTVVVVPKDHLLTALDEVAPSDLDEETLLVPRDDVLHWTTPPGGASRMPPPETTEAALELVAAGVGVVVVPQSLARLHHRRDLTYRTLLDAPTSTVHLAWPSDRTTDDVETFVGIVRGRTRNSSRGPRDEEAPRADDERRVRRTSDQAAQGRGTQGRSGRPGSAQARGARSRPRGPRR